ncbi:GDP-mannose 4,6-dehydratase [Pelagicoccus mobilis]|uniref:GDP-mannose 4,6-dehydratase n=1 Tax=Pelagicoccus mobilis TaxID=415221 RepID=A0A934S1L9_9BACT|nr:GDP-mannose 4,6-dehydratase [Pelagicoccus mobilis]MBK1879495.1 GDP-mannose 4,6-dehydratase [Pelagicoccus mobilis]
MKILVTGCAGFIGWKTSSMLLEQGVEVVGIDNINDYYDRRLKIWRLSQLRDNNSFEFVEGDIENRGLLGYLFVNHTFDAVINLAARAGVRYSMVNPHIYLNSNADGTLNLLECMRKHRIKKLVLASTSSLYAGQDMPFVETLPVNQPISPYAASKKAAETMAYTYHYLYGFDVSIVRYFTVYGPAGRPDMSPLRFIKWIDQGTPITLYGDGSQSRDFTYIDDIATGTIAALKPLGYEIINLGGGKNPISINRMISGIEKILDKKAIIDEQPFNKSDMLHTWADITKANKLLDWRPQTTFEEGFLETVEWYKNNKSWLDEIEL